MEIREWKPYEAAQRVRIPRGRAWSQVVEKGLSRMALNPTSRTGRVDEAGSLDFPKTRPKSLHYKTALFYIFGHPLGGAVIFGGLCSGNTESVLKKHYLNLASYTEGAEFWEFKPTGKAGKIIAITSGTKNTKRKTA